MTTTVKMLFDRVLIRQDKDEGVTASGFVYSTKSEGLQTGTVVEVGPGMYDDVGNFVETTVKAGDRVIFTDLAKNKVSVDGEELIVLSEKEVFGILS